MSKLLEIKATKCTLFLYEDEVFKHIPQELLAKGIKRGKGILRQREQVKREHKKIESGR